jgi:endoglucanase
MITAHMDEPGFMVTEVGDNGLITVASVGAHDQRFLPAARLQVGKDKQPGVFLWAPIHFTHDKKDLVEPKDLPIDVGADDKGGVKAKPGERAAYRAEFSTLGGAVVRGKAFDARASCVALLALLSGEPFPFDLHAVFTAQETIGGRGARVAASRVGPDAAFVLRGIECNDLPRREDDDSTPVIRMGGGPALTLVDPGMIAAPALVAHLRTVAESAGIPLQLDAGGPARSEGGLLTLAGAGVPVAVIGIPVRYMRSPFNLLDLADLESTVTLVRSALAALGPQTLER